MSFTKKQKIALIVTIVLLFVFAGKVAYTKLNLQKNIAVSSNSNQCLLNSETNPTINNNTAEENNEALYISCNGFI